MFKTLFSLVLLAAQALTSTLLQAQGDCQEFYRTDYPTATSTDCYGYGVNPKMPLPCCQANIEFDLLFLKSYVGNYAVFLSPESVLIQNEEVTAQIPNYNPVKKTSLVKNLTDWDYGFRFAFSKGFNGVPFQTELEWTHFETCYEVTQTFPSIFTNGLVVPSGNSFNNFPGFSLALKQKINFNLIGLSVFREVLTGPYFSFTPRLGLDYINLSRHADLSAFQRNGSSGGIFEFTNFSSDEFFVQARGLGPFISLESTFWTDCGIYFDGGLKAGLIWTENQVKDSVLGTSQKFSLIDAFYKYKHHLLTPEIVINLNVGFESSLDAKDLVFSAYIGWQGMFFFGLEETIMNYGYGRTFNLQGWNIGASIGF